MKIALVTLSTQGAEMLTGISKGFPEADFFVHASARWKRPAVRFHRIARLVASLFQTYRALVFAAPCGVVVRAIAPHVRHKTCDPAVVVLDVGARHAVSLLSGHQGGANDLAIAIANLVGAQPVVTTTTEAVKDLIVGVGCRRGCTSGLIIQAVTLALDQLGLSRTRVRLLASADLKAREAGLHLAAQALCLPLRLIPGDEIRATCLSFSRTPLAERRVSLPAVAEPCALLAGRRTRLLLRKKIFAGVTVAVAQEHLPWSASVPVIPSTAHAAQNKPLPAAR